jgi:ribose 5-phosphate isomerase B
MKVAIASDHAGFPAKTDLAKYLNELSHIVVDFGCYSQDSVDYPDYGIAASEAVAKKACDRALLICATGIGMSISANKVKDIRAALCWDTKTAELSRLHNNTNVLCLPGKLVEVDLLKQIVKTWLETDFDKPDNQRHKRRLDKIMEYEHTDKK